MNSKFVQQRYDRLVTTTVRLYESYILPKHSRRVSLLDMKRSEFRERKQLMNPILKG